MGLHTGLLLLLALWQLCGSKKVLYILMIVFSSIWLCWNVFRDVMQGPHLFQRWKANEKIVLTIMVFEHIFALWMLILASIKLCCSKKAEDSDAPNDVESPEGAMVAPVQPVAGFTPVNINAGIVSRRHSANPTSM